MSGGVLRHTLIVRHPETSEPVALLAGELVPGWASDLVHSDDLEEGELPQPKKATAKRASSSKSEK